MTLRLTLWTSQVKRIRLFMNDSKLLKHLAINGNCRGLDTELFFAPENSSNFLQANYKVIKKICDSCDVQQQCLEYALRNDVEGIWGGKYHSERKRIRKKLGLKAEPVSLQDFIPNFSDPYHEELMWKYINNRKGKCVNGHTLTGVKDIRIVYVNSKSNPDFHCRICSITTGNKKGKTVKVITKKPSGKYL